MAIDLKQELEAMRAIFQKKPVDYWALGQHANAIDAYLGGSARRRKSTRFFRSELPEIPMSTIYRSRIAARYFTPEDVQKWGITKLELLIPYQHKVHRRVLPEGVGGQVIHLPSKDGSSLVKDFRDCSASELRRVTQRRKLTRKPKAEVVSRAPPAASSLTASTPSLGMSLVFLISAGLLATISLRLMSGAASQRGLCVAAALLLTSLFEVFRYIRHRRAQASAPSPQRSDKLLAAASGSIIPFPSPRPSPKGRGAV